MKEFDYGRMNNTIFEKMLTLKLIN